MNEYVFMAWKSLKSRKLRTYLTALGIIIGVVALVSLITLGEGLEAGIGKTLDRLGPRRIFIGPKVIGGLGSGPPSGTGILAQTDVDTVAKISSVDYVNAILVENLKIEFGREERYKNVQGISLNDLDKLFEEVDIQFQEGRLFEPGDTNVAVIGYKFAEDYFDKEVRLQNSLYLNGVKVRIIGIQKEQGSEDLDYRIAIPLKTMQQILGKPDAVSAITAVAKQGQDVDSVSERIEKELERKRNDENFQVTNPKKVQAQAREIFGIVTLVVSGIAFISLIVGGIGIMNSMYTSVLERRREIGVMKAIGATNNAILRLFLLESGFLGFTGGAIGILIGLGIAFLAIFAINQLGVVQIVVSLNYSLILFGLLFSFILGIVAGVLPAMSAAKLPPVDALRYE
ncbi:ABC transporter permease [Candidatus Woesearchaeota archaeon]|nr:ABC transporter permease [Candidatus Woesearchaeota archaeon]